MKRLCLALALVALGACGMPEEAPDLTLPACDTLRTVFFISRCDTGHARCGLLTTAPEGATATGCTLTVVSQTGPEKVECVEVCQ